jgi:ferritin
MMISEKMQEAINEQMNAELYSSYLYLSMAACFKTMNLNGFAKWMEAQAFEELTHVMKFYNFIHERGGVVTLKPVTGPPTNWESPLTVFEHTYEHEQLVTSLINNLVNLAIEEKDHATNNFLQWFVSEQVEEEASVDEVVQKLKLIGDGQGGGLFLLDQELGQRTVTIPPEMTTFISAGA